MVDYEIADLVMNCITNAVELYLERYIQYELIVMYENLNLLIGI